MTGSGAYKSQGLKDHNHPMGLMWRDLIEDYYTRFIEIWQTSESVDEAHHRVLDTLDPELIHRPMLHGRAHYLSVMGVKLKELPSHSIDWESLNNYAQTFNTTKQE